MDRIDDLAISTDRLSKTYRGVVALHDVSLQIRRHAIYGFLGPNGAGKSTTIKLLLGLTRPTAGSATIFGRDCVRDSIAIRRRVGYLAQEPRYYDHMTARETLRFAARFFYEGPSSMIEARINETLDMVGLEDKADRPTKGFSGGERQRLGIAQALINEPELLILDEPAAALDPMGRRDVLAIIERLRGHTTIFYSTHILDDVQRVSDSVAILSHGRLIAQAPIAELLSGHGAAVYTLALTGDVAAVRARLAQVPWITRVVDGAAPTVAGEPATVEVTVSDQQRADAELLAHVVAGGRTVVTAYGRKQHDLEEVFMEMVEGGANHAHT